MIWGAYHGVFLVLERLGLEKFLQRLWFPLQHAYTLLVVMLGWVFFRVENLGDAPAFLAALAGFAGGSGVEHYAVYYLDPERCGILLFGVIGAAPLLPWFENVLARWKARRPGVLAHGCDLLLVTAGNAALLGIFLLCAMNLAAVDYNPFIYFRF